MDSLGSHVLLINFSCISSMPCPRINGQSKPHTRQLPTFALSALRHQFWQLRANWAVAQLILQSPVQPQRQPKRIITTFALWFPAADANLAQTKHLPPLLLPPVLLRFWLLCNRHRVGHNYHLLLQYTPCILSYSPTPLN